MPTRIPVNLEIEQLSLLERKLEALRRGLGLALAPLAFIFVWWREFPSLSLEAHRLAAVMAAVVVLCRRAVALALDRSSTIEVPRARGRALARLAKALDRMGLKAEATTTFAAALEAARQIDEALSRVYGLVEIAELLAAAGRPNEARQAVAEAGGAIAKIAEPDMQQQARQHVDAQAAKLPP